MRPIYFLLIFGYFLSCDAQSSPAPTTPSPFYNQTSNEFCKHKCEEKCIPCQEPIKCTESQRDCGLSKPDPAYGGVCPPHSICVEKEFNCK